MTVNEEVYRNVLNAGYTLHWYEVKSVLGRGAFGVTYLARDKNLDQLVAIKEYFPQDFSSRATGYTVHPTTGENKELFDWGLSRFTREAQILAKFKHHNIVRVLSVFELNSTAYMVMEYEQGEELSKLFKRNKNLSEQALLAIFLPIMEGLKLVHDAGFIHRDIKPANIYLRADESPVLIDFGAARKTVGTPTRAITSLVTVGYAPFEQYNESDEKQGAWTDIYALGACLYYAVSGRLPHDALARGSSLLSRGIDPYEPLSVVNGSDYSHGFLLAIDHALLFQADDRPQDILFWVGMLSGKVEVPPLPTVWVKQPMEVNNVDATVIKARPHSVPPFSGVSQANGQTITTPRLTAIRPQSRLNVKVIVSLLFALSVFVAGAIVIFGDKGRAPDVDVEEGVEKSDQRQLASLLASADEARKAGKLIDAERGAIYLYKRILNIDPGNSEAAQRIEEVIELYVDGIRSDLAQGYNDEVERNIRLLRAAVPESSAALTLIDEVRVAKLKQRDISELREQAVIDLKAGRFISPLKQNALWRYRRILGIAPENPAALQGIETILAHYVTLAKKNLKQGDIAGVERNIKDIITVNPDSVEVEMLREALNAEKPQREKMSSLLSKAQIAFAAGNILNPPDISALALYQRVLKLDKNNSKANKGLKNVERYLDSRFKKYLSAGDFVLAKSLMRKIEKRMPRSRFARNVRAEWKRSKLGAKPDIDIISDMIGKFKHSFESRDVNALQKMSKFVTNRKTFLLQFFNNYTAFRLNISGVKYIGHKRTGSASVAIVDLVNKRGVAVEPGTWSRFEIKIYRNTQGKWKIVW